MSRWTRPVLNASSLLAHRPRTAKPLPIVHHRSDPYELVAPQLSLLRSRLLNLLGSAHPSLSELARCYFLQQQQLRSLVALLFSHATNGLGRNWPKKSWDATHEPAEQLDEPLKVPDVLQNWHPSMPNDAQSFEGVFELRQPPKFPPPPPPLPTTLDPILPQLANPPQLLPSQLRLAQIVEMIHIASELHDAVYDDSPVPRDTSNDGFSNKLTILAGDFLLGRASTALSRLGEPIVVEYLASVISNLAEGEMSRIHGPGLDSARAELSGAWDAYHQKNYLKTANLLAYGARAAVVLGGCCDGGDVWENVAYTYGSNLGVAYQLIRDALEYQAGGKNLVPGVVAAPVLYASEEHPCLQPLIERNLTGKGDIKCAVKYVTESDGIKRTRVLAQLYAEAAQNVLRLLPDSESKTALDALAEWPYLSNLVKLDIER